MTLLPEPASPFATLRDRVAAVDPGGFAARTALRAAVALAASALFLLAYGRPYGDPVLLAIVGGEVAMLSSASVSDPRVGEQRVTLVLCILASAVAIVLAALVASRPWLAIVLLCAITFGAVYARKIGPRGSSVGLLGFFGYFLALYVGARASQLRGMLGAILIGGAIAYVVHFWIVREDIERVRQAVLRSFTARVLLLLDQVAIDAESREHSARRARRIRRATGRVGEVALALEQAVGRADGTVPPPHVREWVSSLLHAEVAVDMLVEAVQRVGRRAPGDDRRSALARMVRSLRPWLADGDVASRDEALRIYAEARAARDARGDTSQPEVWWRLDRALETLTAARPWAAFPPLDGEVESGVSVSSFNPGGGGAAGVPGPSPELRLAVQATLAVALAVVAGRAISGARWYWAAIAAYVVFVRATTVGETFSRAWQRVLGTLVGVAIGLLVATLVGHRPWPAAVVGFVAVFFAYYLMRISYTGMIACFTVSLALLYEEMGRAPASLMALRLAETFAGAAIGVLVSALVLPVRSTTRVRALAADVLRSATPAIERATTPGINVESDAQLHDEIRNVDRALADLRSALRPLWGPNVPVERTDVTRAGRISAALAYATRRLSAVSLS
ncbi:MAG TPA: FUSC family protein, partial [Gemmatimonadaceae bacterium]